MSARRTAWWEAYRPCLFSRVDIKASYLSAARFELRGFQSDTLIRVEESVELLVLGYEALREIGGKGLPSEQRWDNLIAQVADRMIARARTFDIGEAVVRGDPRVDPLQPDTYSKGSLDIMLLQDEILHTSADGDPSPSTLKCLLSLMWLDEAVEELLHGSALTGVEYALRGRGLLDEIRPRLSRKEARSEVARENAQKKLAQDPKQQMMRAAKVLWKEHRLRFPSKAKLAGFIQDELPGLESEANLVRRFGQWEKESSSDGE